MAILTRSIALTGGPLLNTDRTPRVGMAVSVYLLTATGKPVKDLDGNIYFSGQQLSSVGTQTDATGSWTENVIVFPEDLRNPDGSAVACQLVVTEGSLTTVSPVGFAFAASIAVPSWYSSAGGADVLTVMTLDARTVAMYGLQGASVSIDITISAITPSGAVIIAGQPAQATTDANGHLSVALVPTANLNPSSARYMLSLPSGDVWYFHVPLTGPSAIDTNLDNMGAPGMVAITPPPFGASGSGHAIGSVPDPGSVAGITKYLREDATFAVPPGGSGGAPSLLGPDGTVPSGYLPLTRGTVAELGRWTRIATNPILQVGVAWESTGLAEPSFIVTPAAYQLFYGAGWIHDALGLATCPRTADPAIAANWTKAAGNPVLGRGGSGYAGEVWHPTVLLLSGTYYAYFSDAGSGNIRVATSTDGNTWATPTLALAGTTWANTFVWEDTPGAWKMLVEGYSGGTWNTSLATGTSPLGPFTIDALHSPLPGLNVVAGGAVSGPWMPSPVRIDGLYQLYYHTSTTPGSIFPCSIYRATSPDLFTWTVAGPVLSPLLSGLEVEAVGDVCVVEVDGTSRLLYTGSHEAVSVDVICMAIFPGTLHQLVAGTPLPLTDPTTAEGDLLYRHGGALARLALGTNLSVTSGVLNAAGGADGGEVLMQDGVSTPPVPLTNEAGTDWLYG